MGAKKPETVQQEISIQYNDNGAAISRTLQTNWSNWNRALIQELRLIIGESPGSGTFNVAAEGVVNEQEETMGAKKPEELRNVAD